MILTLKELQDHLSNITYQDGWKISLYQGATEGVMCLIEASLPDNFNKEENFTFQVYTPVPPQVSIESFNLWLNWRLYRIAIHESMEKLQINGEPIINPHRENANRDIL